MAHHGLTSNQQLNTGRCAYDYLAVLWVRMLQPVGTTLVLPREHRIHTGGTSFVSFSDLNLTLDRPSKHEQTQTTSYSVPD